MILRLLKNSVIDYVFIFMLISVLSCHKINKTSFQADLWINHSPRELSENLYREWKNEMAKIDPKYYKPIPDDSVIDISKFSPDTIYWPLFVIIDKGMPYEYKDVCNEYGAPYESEFTISYNIIYNSLGIYNTDMDDGLCCIDDFDEDFARIINRFVTVDDSLWHIKSCVWQIGKNYYEAFYRKMGPDSLRIISANIQAPSDYE